jgi:hypothetical protein
MADYKYPGATPVDEPVAKSKTSKAKTSVYTDSVPVDEPVSKPKKYAKGGSVRGSGCEQRGKTKGRFV